MTAVGRIARPVNDITVTASSEQVALSAHDERPETPANGKYEPADAEAIKALAVSLVSTCGPTREPDLTMPGLVRVLTYLAGFPGDSWQDRWELASSSTDVWNLKTYNPARWKRAIACLVCAHIIRLPWSELWGVNFARWLKYRKFWEPEEFARLLDAPGLPTAHTATRRHTETAITAMCLHFGILIKDISEEHYIDFVAYANSVRGTKGVPRRTIPQFLTTVLERAGNIPSGGHRTSTSRLRAPSTPQSLVAKQTQLNPAMSEVFSNYLTRKARGDRDFSTIKSIWANLQVFAVAVCSAFPDQQTLALTPAQWETIEPLLINTKTGQPRAHVHHLRMTIAALYDDISHWAARGEPHLWAGHVSAAPWERADLARALNRHVRRGKAERDERTTRQIMSIDDFAEAALALQGQAAALLEVAANTPYGEIGQYRHLTFQRLNRPIGQPIADGHVHIYRLSANGTAKSSRIDLTLKERHTFNGWAMWESLHQTGIRIEELTEITKDAVAIWTSSGNGKRQPETRTRVPVLRIKESKSDRVRFVPLSPEAIHVLALVVSRLKRENNGIVPTLARWDPHEETESPPLQYLFVHNTSGRMTAHNQVTARASFDHIARCIVTPTGITSDPDSLLDRLVADRKVLQREYRSSGQVWKPHDMRHLFVSQTVNTGVPVEVVRDIVGHQSLSTTQGYLTTSQDRVMREYAKYLESRHTQDTTEDGKL